MTKVDIIESIYERWVFKEEVAKIVESVFDMIKESLQKEDKIKISALAISWSGARNPSRPKSQTGSDIEITARRILTFKPSQVLKGSQPSEDVGTPKEIR